MAVIERMCLENLESVRDPELRARLRPDYRAGCKRLVVSPDFYEAMQKPHVALVDQEIAWIEPSGVRTADRELHELDVLVLATGFHADAFMRPMAVTGRDGVTLTQRWAPRPNAYLSISMPDFPNFFMINGPNGPVGNFSLIEVAERQFAYILQLVAWLRDGTAREVAPTVRATQQHEAARAEAASAPSGSPGARAGTSTIGASPPRGPGRSTTSARSWPRPDPDCYELR